MVSLKPRHFLLLKGGRSRIKGQREEKKEPVRPSSRLPLAIIFVIPGFRPNRVPRLPVFTTGPPLSRCLLSIFGRIKDDLPDLFFFKPRSKWKKRSKYNYKRDPEETRWKKIYSFFFFEEKRFGSVSMRALSFTLPIIHPPSPFSSSCPLSHSTRWKFSGIIRDLRRGKLHPPPLTYLVSHARKMNGFISPTEWLSR